MPFIKKSFESSLVEIEVQNVRTKGEQKSSLEIRRIHPSSTNSKVSTQYISAYEVGQFFLNLAETCHI